MARPIYKKREDFRVLLFYPNMQMSALMPQAIGLLTSILRNDGFCVDLFDCTFYEDSFLSNTNQEKVYQKKVRPFTWSEKGVIPKIGLVEDFLAKVEYFDPDLVAMSAVESTFTLGIDLLKKLPRRIPTIVGGVFATHAPDKVIRESVVDYVCRGEGEEALLELCRKLADGGSIEGIGNLWIKRDGRIYKNPMRQPLNLDELPFPDFDLFESNSIYRPMQGRIYRTIGVETQRGCPFTCTFCNSPSNNAVYREDNEGRFHRKKSIERMHEELTFLQKKYQPELIYFVADTCLAMSDEEFANFRDMYRDFRIPFWMNTRVETINEARAEGLEVMNMLRMSMGIEHGNEVYRRKMLKRSVSNDKIIRAFRDVAGRKYTTVANSMLGLPDETRELVFDTIRLNRQLPREIEASGAFIWAPYHGTALRDIAIEKGYLEDDAIVSTNTAESVLNMPGFSRDEISGLCRTFSFYVKLPEERFPEIRNAERMTSEGNIAFERLSNECEALWGVG